MRDFAANHPLTLRAILLALSGALVLCGQMACATPLESVPPIQWPTRQETRLESQIMAALNYADWQLSAVGVNIRSGNESSRAGDWNSALMYWQRGFECGLRAIKAYRKAEKLQARLERMRERRR